MKTFLNNLKGGLTIGLGILIMLSIGGIVYASLSSEKVESGDILTAEMWNNLSSNIEIPSGLVASFNLKECPNGWLPANGSGSVMGEDIPDLRGRFIRGLNSFENGNNILTGTGGDEDGASRILGSYQNDQIRPITGDIEPRTTTTGGGGLSSDLREANGAFYILSNAGLSGVAANARNGGGSSYDKLGINTERLGINFQGKDTHPKNISLIYCVKQ